MGAVGFEKLNRETLHRGHSFHELVHRFLQDGAEPDPDRASAKVYLVGLKILFEEGERTKALIEFKGRTGTKFMAGTKFMSGCQFAL